MAVARPVPHDPLAIALHGCCFRAL